MPKQSKSETTPKPSTKTVKPVEKTTVKFNLIIPQADIKTAYSDVVDESIKSVKIKGFRQGKAPRHLVESSLDQNKLYEHVFNHVFPPAYQKYIKAHQLKPIISPHIKVNQAATDGDWDLEVEIALSPEVTLGDYRQAVKSALSQGKLWVPGQDKSKKPDDQDRLNGIFSALLTSCPVDISHLLVEDEANRTLSQLLNQIEKLGLTLDQYVASLNKSVDQLRQEHLENASGTLKLEYIIAEIAKKENLSLTDAEYADFLEKVTDPKTKKELQTNENAQLSVRYTLTKKKVIDLLQSLA